MNPLTLVKRIQSINAKEADLGISDEASWHAKYRDSAYVFVGGIPYDLTEGDLLAVFAQYGEIVDVNLVRDKATGKSKGFAFIAYEDQRSTTLAVDNLNGAQLGGRTIRVDHVAKYKKKEEEDEETERQKREERGVCRAFQKGECKYGDSCKFSHDAQRAADTGWGREEDKNEKWENDKFDSRSRGNQRSHNVPPIHGPRRQPDANDGRSARGNSNIEAAPKHNKIDYNDRHDARDRAKPLEYKEDRNKQTVEGRSSRYESDSRPRDDFNSREEKRPRRHDTQSSLKDTQDERDQDRDRFRDRDREKEKRSYTRDHLPQRQREKDDDDHRRPRRDEDYHRSRR